MSFRKSRCPAPPSWPGYISLRYLTQCPRRAQLISVLLWFEPHLEIIVVDPQLHWGAGHPPQQLCRSDVGSLLQVRFQIPKCSSWCFEIPLYISGFQYLVDRQEGNCMDQPQQWPSWRDGEPAGLGLAFLFMELVWRATKWRWYCVGWCSCKTPSGTWPTLTRWGWR